jgi:hypothetical protein
VWFGGVALAQLRLTELELRWTTGFTILVFGGGLAFLVATVLAGGTAAARGRVEVRAEDYRLRRVVTAAVVLGAAGAVGAAYKAHVLMGVPLLSGQADEVRAHAILPSWSSALTNGFYLGMWCALIAIWLLPKGSSRVKVAALWLLAAVLLFGVALEASRNLVVFALTVPVIGAYLLARPRRTRALVVWIGVALGVVGLLVGGAFVARLSQTPSAGHAYLNRELDRQPAALRPVVPIYINVAYPLQAEDRLYHAIPGAQRYGLGAYSLTSLPDAAFPHGKDPYGDTVAVLMAPGGAYGLRWTVATYQGRLYGDLGWQGVLLGSLLLGLAFGALYRWARSKTGFLPVAMVGYLAYYAAFMVYDNLLSFTFIAVFDLAVILVLERYVRAELDEPIRALVRLARV